MSRKKRVLAVIVTLSILLGLVWTAVMPPVVSVQADNGCTPGRGSLLCSGPSYGCNGLTELTVFIYAKDTGAKLGERNLGCHSCSSGSRVCFTASHSGYQSYRVCVNPTQARNGQACHVDVFLCPEVTPTPPPTFTPTPTPPAGCNADYVDVQPPTAEMITRPEHPVVVGQDIEKRGVDMEVTVGPGRASHHKEWWEKVCNTPGCTIPDDPWHWECVDHVLASYVDQITYVAVGVRLGDDTVDWINGTLAHRYPGARVMGSYPELFVLLDDPNGVSSFHDTIERYQSVDPGEYGGRIYVHTAGTPISDPQRIEPPFNFKVWMREATIWW